MFSKQLMQTRLKFQIVITGFLLTLLTVNIVTTAVRIPVPLVFAMTMMPGNHTSGGTGNMTFRASLQNAKMHLMEAMTDLKGGNTKGAMIELNLTDQGIKMHEQEIKSMMMEVKSMMTKMKEASNITSSSSTLISKNATS
ncbi:MAG TPA: hypothetical protein VEL70_00935 [Candidatus Acidoferrum sp.]|nr:hypothetical protein [Candidatus Acidoferrum sp.]